MNFLLLLLWITNSSTQPPALYVKLGIQHINSLLLYLRTEAYTLKIGWILRSVGTCAHKKGERDLQFGDVCSTVSYREGILKQMFRSLNILSVDLQKSKARYMSIRL